MVTTENLEYMEYRTLKENAYLPKIISLKFLIHTFQIHICSAYVCANTHTVRYPFLSLVPLWLPHTRAVRIFVQKSDQLYIVW